MKPLIRSDKDTRDLRLHLQEEKHEDDLWLDETSPIVLELRAEAPGDLFLLAGGYRLMSAKPTIHFGPVFVFPLHAFIGGEADRFNWVCRQNIDRFKCWVVTGSVLASIFPPPFTTVRTSTSPTTRGESGLATSSATRRVMQYTWIRQIYQEAVRLLLTRPSFDRRRKKLGLRGRSRHRGDTGSTLVILCMKAKGIERQTAKW